MRKQILLCTLGLWLVACGDSQDSSQITNAPPVQTPLPSTNTNTTTNNNNNTNTSSPTSPKPEASPSPLAKSFAPEHPLGADPTVMQEGEWFYVYSTHEKAHRTKDFLTWQALPTYLDKVKQPTSATQRFGPPSNVDTWAPQFFKVGDTYYLFYSAVKDDMLFDQAIDAFGKDPIGMAGTLLTVNGVISNKTLDPNSPNYQWKDEGTFDAANFLKFATAGIIDIFPFQDQLGQLWLSSGSQGMGIFMFKLKKLAKGFEVTLDKLIQAGMAQTGLLPTYNGDFGGEASFMHYRAPYYYFFYSRGDCCQAKVALNGLAGEYNLQVARSLSPNGPFLDRDGLDAALGGGQPILKSYAEDNRQAVHFKPGHGDLINAFVE